jgi:flagellar basal-body rod modification protein FlgD
MTSTFPTTNLGSSGISTSNNSRSLGSDLGQEDFIKLLTIELSSQDPLDPKKDSEFISQIMQISSLEQAKATQEDIAAMRLEQRLLQANSMLGQEVSLDTPDGNLIGEVTEVRLDNGIPRLVVSGQRYDFNQLLSVALPTPNTDLVEPLTEDEQYA